MPGLKEAVASTVWVLKAQSAISSGGPNSTAQKSALVIGPLHQTRLTVTWVWQPDASRETQTRARRYASFISRFHTYRDWTIQVVSFVFADSLSFAKSIVHGSLVYIYFLVIVLRNLMFSSSRHLVKSAPCRFTGDLSRSERQQRSVKIVHRIYWQTE